METAIHEATTVDDYNKLFDIESVHPLVSIIDFSKCKPMRNLRCRFGFYAVFLKEVKCGDLVYGRQKYDYGEGTVVCVAPGQVMGVEDDGKKHQFKGKALCFSPELIHGTSLGKNIREYSFFSYDVREALHLSEEERSMFNNSLQQIENELQQSQDRLSKRLIAKHIELLLDYCLRFYERQFATRKLANTDILSRFEQLLDNYLTGSKAPANGLPTVKYCAAELCLSSNYFGDLIKKETGRTAQEYIHEKILAIAKEQILDSSKSISQIAYSLGFQYPQHFTKMFKSSVGVSPNTYRKGM